MTAMPPRPVGRLLEALLKTLWAMKLERAEFRDIEDSAAERRVGRDGRVFSGISPEEFAPDSEQRREFYRYIEQGRWNIKNPKDRRIANALAEGESYRAIMRRERVGQFRIERVLFTLVNGRKEPWHWRKGKPREKGGKRLRQLLERRRRRASTRP